MTRPVPQPDGEDRHSDGRHGGHDEGRHGEDRHGEGRHSGTRRRPANAEGFRWFPPGPAGEGRADASVDPAARPGTGGAHGPAYPDSAEAGYSDGGWGWDGGTQQSFYPGIHQPVPGGGDPYGTPGDPYGPAGPADGLSRPSGRGDGGRGDGGRVDEADSGPALAGAIPAFGVGTTPGVSAADSGIPGSLEAAATAVAELTRQFEELARLRRHDTDLVDRLHAENGRLRQGELTEAMSPLLRGLIRLHDQMTSLGGDDPQSVAGILRGQLLQVLDLTVDVRPYTAVPGSPFDPARHLGVRGVPTDDPGRDRTVVRTVKPGFVRGEFTVVRPAETEVYRAH